MSRVPHPGPDGMESGTYRAYLVVSGTPQSTGQQRLSGPLVASDTAKRPGHGSKVSNSIHGSQKEAKSIDIDDPRMTICGFQG